MYTCALILITAFANRRADISVPAPSEATSVGRQTPSTNVDFPQSAAGAAGLDSIAEKSARTEQQNHNVTEMSTTAVASGHTPVQTVVTTDAGAAAEQAMEGASNIVRTASCAEIQIGVEAENGEQVPLEIDDDDAQNAKEKPEDNNTLNTTGKKNIVIRGGGGGLMVLVGEGGGGGGG